MDKMTKQFIEAKKVHKVEKEKKSETPEQRAKRFSPFNPLKPLAVGGLLATATMVEATKAESNKVAELADRMQHSTYKSLAEGYVPSRQQIEQAKRWYEEKERNVPFYYGPKEAQGTSSGETSQSSKETHQGEQDKNKGMEPSSVSKKKITALQALVKADRQRIESLIRKVERQMARQQRQLKEQESREPEQKSKQASSQKAWVSCHAWRLPTVGYRKHGDGDRCPSGRRWDSPRCQL